MTMTAPGSEPQDRTETPEQFARRMDAMLNITRDEQTGDLLRPHMLWELNQIMQRIKPDDLATSEIMGLLAVLVPIHSRFLDDRGISPPFGPVPLRLV